MLGRLPDNEAIEAEIDRVRSLGARAIVERLAYVASRHTTDTARDNGDRVPLALIFAHQHGAGLEPPWPTRIVAAREAVEKLGGLAIKTTECLLLDAPAQEPRHEVFGERRRRARPQRRAPQRAKLVEADAQ